MPDNRRNRLELTVPAEATRLRDLRQTVADFLSAHGASQRARAAAVLAVHEACSNVVRHAYGPEGGPLQVRGLREGDLVQFVVTDSGTPVADPNARPGAGIGLKLIHELADNVDIEGPGEHGTSVRMTFRLARRGPPAPRVDP